MSHDYQIFFHALEKLLEHQIRTKSFLELGNLTIGALGFGYEKDFRHKTFFSLIHSKKISSNFHSKKFSLNFHRLKSFSWNFRRSKTFS